jgi:CheY-like chemotaxis protein
MDVQMPVLDGLETTRVIRQDPQWDSLPIIGLTAHIVEKEESLSHSGI